MTTDEKLIKLKSDLKNNSNLFIPGGQIVYDFLQTIDEVIEDNKMLRILLWLRHGCDITSLYGDDGELQCGKCIIDFKRDDALKIAEKFEKLNADKLKIGEKDGE